MNDRPVSFHVLLFAVFPILFLFSHNVNQVPLSEIVLPILVMFGASALCIIFLHLIGDKGKIALVTTLSLIFFFSYVHVCQVLRGILKTESDCVWFLYVWGGLFLLCGFLIIRLQSRLNLVIKTFNTFGIVLVSISLVNSGTYLLNRKSYNDQYAEELQVLMNVSRSQSEKKPDIYYLIFDRYGSNSCLKEIYDFDNSEFLDYLSEKGFFVATRSNSNYLKTAHSLASSLNMSFLDEICSQMGTESNDWLPLQSMLQEYQVWKFLKMQGYKFLHFGSWWQPTCKNRNADMNYNIYPLREFMMLLYKTTILYSLNKNKQQSVDFLNFKDRHLHYERILYKFDKLKEVSKIKEPTFAFAHMLIPHDPFVFDQEGNFLTRDQADKRGRKKNLIEQVMFANMKIRELIDTLFVLSDTRPIIIIQSDEGPYPKRYHADQDNFQWKEATCQELRQKMGIINAIYLPDVGYDMLYDSISPVNTFRVVFNQYFGTQLELLPDRCYAFKDGSHPYDLFDVTDKLK